MNSTKMRAHARKIVACLVFAAVAIGQIFQSLHLGIPTNSDEEPEDQAATHNKSIINSNSHSHSNHEDINSIHNNNDKITSATFLGFPLSLHHDPPRSMVHCVGDNFLPKTSAGFRSCQFRHLCWDWDQKDFVIMPSDQHQRALTLLDKIDSDYLRASFNLTTRVSTSATTESKLRQGVDGTWFPRVLVPPITTSSLASSSSPSSSSSWKELYYELPRDVVLVPVEFPQDDGSMETKDVLFDFFLPIYNLLAMFDLQEKRILLANLRPSCTKKNATTCHSQVMHFLPLMNRDENLKNIVMNLNDRIILQNAQEENKSKTEAQSKLVCARFGAAGIGALTGEELKSQTSEYNLFLGVSCVRRHSSVPIHVNTDHFSCL